MKKAYLLIFFLLFLFALPKNSWAASPVTISPTKDTYLSLSGALSEPSSNFGLADYIYVGDGWDGHCIGVFEFDLSSVPSSISSYSFSCDMTVYGDQTRTMKVFLLTGIVWNEVSITALNSPFDGYGMWTDSTSAANCTTITFGSSQDELSFTFTTTIKAKITLVFAFSPTDDSWITIYAQENSYSWVNMAHLEYIPPTNTFDNLLNIAIRNVITFLFLLGVGIGLIVMTIVLINNRAKKRKIKAQQDALPPTFQNFGGSPTSIGSPALSPTVQEQSCRFCGKLNPVSAKFCNSCGKNL